MEIINTIIGLAMWVGLLVSPFYVIKWLRAANRQSAQKYTQRLDQERQKTVAGVPGKAERAYFKSCPRAIKLTKRGHVSCRLRALRARVFIESRIAAYRRCSTDDGVIDEATGYA